MLSQIDLKIAAKLAGTSYDELIALNPGYNRWATDPDGPHAAIFRSIAERVRDQLGGGGQGRPAPKIVIEA